MNPMNKCLLAVSILTLAGVCANAQSDRAPAVHLFVSNGMKGTMEELQPQAEKAIGKDRKSTRLNSSHIPLSRMPSSA